jgi:hypothetical protein
MAILDIPTQWKNGQKSFTNASAGQGSGLDISLI